MGTLKQLDDPQRSELLRIYDDLDAIADRLRRWGIDTNIDSARRSIRRWRNQTEDRPTPDKQLPADTLDFDRYIDSLKQKHNWIQVAHMADVHFPYQDNAALQLAYELIAHVQPHVIVVGSDTFDYQYLSSFDSDPDVAQYDDELDLAESYWNPHIHAIRQAAPNARMVFIWGNHERRIIRYMCNHAPKLRNTVWRRFAEIVRCGGAVDYLGETDRVQIGRLLVQHGNTATKYAAKAHLEDQAYQLHTMFGHTHRMHQYMKAGPLFNAQAVGSGCLCELQPHYMRGRSMRNRWTHGMALADLSLHSGDVTFYNQQFFSNDNRMYTRLGFETVEVELARAVHRAA